MNSRKAFDVACAGLIAGALVFASLPAAAQTTPNPQPPAASGSDDVFGSIGRWLDRSFSSVGDPFKSAGQNIESFNREAGIAAKATAGAAADAADAVVRIPRTRVVTGHQICVLAANGAPDCSAAADKLCQGRGLSSGKSLDVTAAEECPLRVHTGQREAQAGECKNVTFVTRAMCQ